GFDLLYAARSLEHPTPCQRATHDLPHRTKHEARPRLPHLVRREHGPANAGRPLETVLVIPRQIRNGDVYAGGAGRVPLGPTVRSSGKTRQSPGFIAVSDRAASVHAAPDRVEFDASIRLVGIVTLLSLLAGSAAAQPHDAA